jgi:hypothetical protein
MLSGFFYRGALFAVTVALVAACASHGVTIPSAPASSQIGGAVVTFMQPDAKPPKCSGQKTTKQYATLTAALSPSGGSFCIPAIGGFGGSVDYPSVSPSVKVTVTSSVKNYAHLSQLGSGMAIFYLQLSLSGGTTFGSSVSAGGGLTSKKIKSGSPYTIFGEATIDGFKVHFQPCYTAATTGKYGGVIGGVGTLLEGEQVPSAASGFIEIYAGAQASKQC